mgnify:CR=1 FL=1
MEDVFLPDEVVLDESCGCHREELNAKNSRVLHSEEIARRKMIHQLISLEKNYTECTNIYEWLEAVRNFISKVDIPPRSA